MFVNKDQIKGRAKEAKGKIKEVTGDLVGNQKLETEGKIEKNLGKAQAKVGDVKQDLKHKGRAPRLTIRATPGPVSRSRMRWSTLVKCTEAHADGRVIPGHCCRRLPGPGGLDVCDATFADLFSRS